jgi:F0F1-type ATP synthase alpha subunit
MAATEGALDGIDAEKIGLAKDALLAALEKKAKKLTEKLDKGEKPDDKDKKTIIDIAAQIAKEYKKADK